MTQNRNRGISIFIKMLIIFLCVNIATSGVLLMIAFGFHRQSIEQRTKETVTQQLEILRDNFEYEYRLNLKRSLDVLVASSIIDDYLTVSKPEKMLLKKKIEQMFIQTLKAYRTYHSIGFVDADGKISILVTEKLRHKETVNLKQIKSVSPNTLSPSVGASLKLFETLESIPLLLSGGYMEWFMPPRELQLEGPYMDENGTLSLLAGVSKLDLDVGSFGGVLMIRQKLENFFEGLRDVKFFNENLIWVFDANGRLLQSPEKKEYHFDPTSYLSETSQKTPKLIDTKEGLVVYQDFFIIPGQPFVRVAISIPAALLLKDFATAIRFFSIVLICSIIMVLLVGLYVSRYLSEPIIELAHAANRLSEGDLTTRVDVKTTGEVQLLVNSFNQMAEELQQTIMLNVRLDEAAKRKEELERINRELEGAKHTLAEREQRYRMLTGNLPGIVYRVDLGTINNLTFFNDMLYPLTGYRDKELTQAKICALESIIIQEDNEKTIAKVKDAVSKMQPFEIEYRVKHKYGETKFFLERGRPVNDSNGKPKYIDGVILDVTDGRQAEEERQMLEAQLQQAQKMESVGRLAGGVAHDYNNALTTILGFTELAMMDADPTGALHADLNQVLKAGRYATDITRQLLAFARKQTIAPEVLGLNGNVESMLKMIRRLIGEDIDLTWIPGKSLGNIKMDPSQMDQILANLCVNARDAIEGVGKITIETAAKVFDVDYCADHLGFVPGRFVLLTVSDNGCGMDKETLSNIFEPFFTTKDVDKGTGLGLSTVYGIVKQNNGFINAYSEPGIGTAIKIYLPLHDVKTDEIQGESTEKIPQGHGETILLVEDDLSVLKLAEKILKKLNYTVLIAGTPKGGIKLAEDHTGEIHLLVTDVIMPEMNGLEVSKQLNLLYPDLKCIFMSGYTANAIAHHGVLDKGVHFVQKPFSKKDLALIVRKVLDE